MTFSGMDPFFFFVFFFFVFFFCSTTISVIIVGTVVQNLTATSMSFDKIPPSKE